MEVDFDWEVGVWEGDGELEGGWGGVGAVGGGGGGELGGH